MMSQTEIREWLSLKIIPIKGTCVDLQSVKSPSRLTSKVIARHLGTDHGNLWNMIRGNRKFPKQLHRELSNFIQEWETGEWNIQIKGLVKCLVRNETPKKPVSFKVNLGTLTLSKPDFYQKRDVMPSKLWRE
jgi:hypothetical protein